MKSKHCYVVLIDLPEALPFEVKEALTKPSKIKKVADETERAGRELFNFVSKLEKNFKEEFSFIGEDIIGEKFYKRFLFPQSGFMEILYQAPVAIIAHFLDIKRAKRFSKALEKTIEQTVKDKKILMILKNIIEVNTEEEEALTYEKWSKMRGIRSLSES